MRPLPLVEHALQRECGALQVQRGRLSPPGAHLPDLADQRRLHRERRGGKLRGPKRRGKQRGSLLYCHAVQGSLPANVRNHFVEQFLK